MNSRRTFLVRRSSSCCPYDYKAFIAIFPGADACAVTTFQPGGSPSYIANWGTYAAISEQQALVSEVRDMSLSTFLADIPASQRARLLADQRLLFADGGVGPQLAM